jgi:hypothetical protein
MNSRRFMLCYGQMNYRRGLQRVYAVLTVVWVVLAVIVAIRNRPPDTSRPDPWDVVTLSREADSALTPDQFEHLIRKRKQSAVVRYWSIQAGIALGTPLAGYLLLFGVIPWIAGGFRFAARERA